MHRSKLAVLPCILAAHLLGAQAPAGYHLGAAVALPDSIVEVWNDGGFRLSIDRSARTPLERELIEKAERLYPDSDRVLDAARTPAERKKLESLASAVLSGSYQNPPRELGPREDRWWLDQFGETWIAFAVTGRAVEYYAGRLRDLASGRGQFVYPSGAPRDRGSFVYQAKVMRGSAPGVAYNVVMHFIWDYTCSIDCGIGFSLTRIVSFAAEGHPIAITGDRRPPVAVS